MMMMIVMMLPGGLFHHHVSHDDSSSEEETAEDGYLMIFMMLLIVMMINMLITYSVMLMMNLMMTRSHTPSASSSDGHSTHSYVMCYFLLNTLMIILPYHICLTHAVSRLLDPLNCSYANAELAMQAVMDNRRCDDHHKSSIYHHSSSKTYQHSSSKTCHHSSCKTCHHSSCKTYHYSSSKTYHHSSSKTCISILNHPHQLYSSSSYVYTAWVVIQGKERLGQRGGKSMMTTMMMSTLMM